MHHAATGSPSKVKKQGLEERKTYIVNTAGGHKGNFNVQILPSKETGVKFMKIINAQSGRPLFMQPLLTCFRDTPEVLQDLMNVTAITDERDIYHPELNMPLMQEGTTYPVKIVICACADSMPDEEFGHFFAAALQTFMNSNPRYHGTANHVVYRQPAALTAAGKQPVRHWLKDRDMLLLLKKVYGWNARVTLDDIMEDEELLEVFFHAPEEGRAFLGRLSEEQWQYLES